MNSSLTKTITDLSNLLLPEPTDTSTILNELPGIKAVIFDVYGTLIISGSGDISLAQKINREEQMRSAISSSGILFSDAFDGSVTEIFYSEIQKAQDFRKSQGIKFPEVEIREIWADVLHRLRSAGAIDQIPDDIEPLAVRYECQVNPVYPMPNLDSTLSALREVGVKLGIVSNAQFYTPLLFEAFLGKNLADLGFDPDLGVWSYKEREGKPSTALYEKLVAALAEQNISADEAVFIGNDIRNDIWPAQAVGLKTVLFAGDARSLRLRGDDPACAHIVPDAVIIDLSQLKEVVHYGA